MAEAFIMRQSFWSAMDHIQHDADGTDLHAYPMIITQDRSGARDCIECITRDWEGRTLSQQVADLLQTRDLLLRDINTMCSSKPGSRPDCVVFPEQGADYLTYPRDKSFVDLPQYLGSYHINVTLPHNCEHIPETVHPHARGGRADGAVDRAAADGSAGLPEPRLHS